MTKTFREGTTLRQIERELKLFCLQNNSTDLDFYYLRHQVVDATTWDYSADKKTSIALENFVIKLWW